MIFFIFKNGNRKSGHVGEEIQIGFAENVVRVQADGDELEAIYDQLEGLPKSKRGRVVNWYGDHAAFIAANLIL